MNIVAIVQARMGSTRLPGKVLADIDNKPAIELLLKRLDRSTKVSSICVATSEAEENDAICQSLLDLDIVILGARKQMFSRDFTRLPYRKNQM